MRTATLLGEKRKEVEKSPLKKEKKQRGPPDKDPILSWVLRLTRAFLIRFTHRLVKQMILCSIWFLVLYRSNRRGC